MQIHTVKMQVSTVEVKIPYCVCTTPIPTGCAPNQPNPNTPKPQNPPPSWGFRRLLTGEGGGHVSLQIPPPRRSFGLPRDQDPRPSRPRVLWGVLEGSSWGVSPPPPSRPFGLPFDLPGGIGLPPSRRDATCCPPPGSFSKTPYRTKAILQARAQFRRMA